MPRPKSYRGQLRAGLKKPEGFRIKVSEVANAEVKSHVGTGLFAQDTSTVGKGVVVRIGVVSVPQAVSRMMATSNASHILEIISALRSNRGFSPLKYPVRQLLLWHFFRRLSCTVCHYLCDLESINDERGSFDLNQQLRAN